VGPFRKPSASHLEVKVQPPRVRRGDEVVVRVRVLDPDAVRGALSVAIRSRRRQRIGSSQPVYEFSDLDESSSEWRTLEGSGPWEERFTVPADGRASGDLAGRWTWRVELRERRTGGRDARTHASFIVRS
jgi:hypothetical protein